MTEYLLFQLYGPMAAWGEVAVGEARVSSTHPGRSVLIGLLAAALGINRDNQEDQQRMAEGYRFAVRVGSAGTFLRDYHTAQVPSRASMKGYPSYTRRDELILPKDDLGTILSNRDYRCDAYYQVAIELVASSSGWSLQELVSALKAPRFPLYLGRKSCPPALPLQPQIVEAQDLCEVFGKAQFTDPDQLIDDLVNFRSGQELDSGGGSLYWDDGMVPGVSARETFTRRDQPRTRRRWQFDERLEHHTNLPSKG